MKQVIIKFRRFIYKKLALRRVRDFQGPIYVNKYSVLSAKTKLGRNVSFNGLKVFGVGSLSIGDNFHSGQDCMVFTSSHNYDSGNAIPYDRTSIPKDVIIEDNVWLGARVLILPGVTLGEGVIVQAGSVVVKSIPKYSIAGGNPAQIFKTRNIEHYLSLKEKSKFN